MRLIELQIERPKSDKNFPRNIMPQIRKGDIKDSDFDYTKEKIDITKLKPVQNQRVKGMHDRAKRGFADGSIRPIVIDKNNYIVNGHHRFDVALQMGMKEIKVLRVDATIEELIDHFSNTSSDAPTFEELMKQKLTQAMTEDWAERYNLNPDVRKYVDDNLWKLSTVSVADLDDEAIDDQFGRVIDVDPDVGVDLDDPIIVHADGKTILDGFHRVYQAKRVGKDVIPAYIPKINENFADGKKKGKSRPGRVKRAGASCKGSVTSLRKKAKNSSGEKKKMYHWCANMKSGRKKS